MTDFETLKQHLSLRGIVMTILALLVAGLAIATVRHQPSAPVEQSIYSPTSATTTPAGPWLAPAPAVETPLSATEPPPAPPPSSTEPPAPPAPVETVAPTETFVPTQASAPAPSPTQPPASAAPPTTSSTFTPRRDTNPTELPNGGRRFGTVEP